MALNDILPAILIFAYLGLLALIIILYGRMKNSSMEEYAVASRSFPWWAVMFTVIATWITAASYTGWFALTSSRGVHGFYIVIYSVVGLVIYYAIAPRVWKWGKLHDLYNMPDFIRLRYNSPAFAVIMAIAGIIIGAPWQILAIKTFGFLMTEATNGTIPFDIGMAIVTIAVLGYIVFAGMRSVVVTDFVQGIIATFGLVIALVLIAESLFGGFGSLLAEVASKHPEQMTVPSKPGYWASIILTGAIGSYAWLEIFNRIFLADEVKELKKVAVGGSFIVIISTFLLYTLALGVGLTSAAGTGQRAFFVMARDAGGPLLLAIVGIVVLAGGMSSIDSQLTTVGVVVSWNIVKEAMPGITNERAVNISRVVIIAWVIFAFYIATLDLPLLAKIAIWTYEFLVQLTPSLYLGMYWRKGNKYGAIAGLLVGLIVTFSINFTLASSIGGPAIAGFTGAIIGLPVNIAIYVVGAYLGPEVDYVDELFKEIREYDGEDSDVESSEQVQDQYNPLSPSEDD
jgi:SSS family solute:Na+ symporter